MPRSREFRARNEMDSVVSVVINTVFFIIGLLVFFDYHVFSPPSIEASLVDPAINIWGLLLLIGSPLVVVGRLKVLHRMESLGDLGVGFAFLIYALAIFSSDFLSGISAGLFFLGISFGMLYKGYRMNKLAKEEAILSGRSPVP